MIFPLMLFFIFLTNSVSGFSMVNKDYKEELVCTLEARLNDLSCLVDQEKQNKILRNKLTKERSKLKLTLLDPFIGLRAGYQYFPLSLSLSRSILYEIYIGLDINYKQLKVSFFLGFPSTSGAVQWHFLRRV